MAKVFFLWATILSPSAGRLLASGLVERGYEVQALASTKVMMREGEASTLVALKASSEEETSTQATLLRQVKEIMEENTAMYHSLIVYHHGGSFTWEGSNIKLPPREEKKPEEPKVAPRTRFDVMDES